MHPDWSSRDTKALKKCWVPGFKFGFPGFRPGFGGLFPGSESGCWGGHDALFSVTCQVRRVKSIFSGGAAAGFRARPGRSEGICSLSRF
jgi:hypothetical protein